MHERFDSECVGLGGSTSPMLNGLEVGPRGEVVIVIKRIEGQCFCGEVSHINVTPRSQHRRDIRRQGNFIHLPPYIPKGCLHLAALCNYSLIFFIKIFKLV